MSKNQRRGNREAKKPKKDKGATAQPPRDGAWLTVEKLQEREKMARDRK